MWGWTSIVSLGALESYKIGAKNYSPGQLFNLTHVCSIFLSLFINSAV